MTKGASKKYLLVLIAILCLTLCLPLLFTAPKKTNAAGGGSLQPDSPDGYEVQRVFFEDDKLYSALLEAYNLYLTDNGQPKVSVLYSGVFASHNITKLRLVDKGITSLADFQWIDLSTIEELDVSCNEITTLAFNPHAESETSSIAITKLNLSSNHISSVQFDNLPNLQELYLVDNSLTSVDISEFEGSIIDLSNNHFDTIEDITLPEQTTCQVNLLNNSIMDVTSTKINNCTLNLGLQRSDNKYKFYNLLDEDIYVKLTYQEQETILESAEEIEEQKLEVGEYKIEFYSRSTEDLVYQGISDIDNTYKLAYKTMEFTILPATPVYTLIKDGKASTQFKNVKKGDKLVFEYDEDLELYIKVNNGEFTRLEGNEYILDAQAYNIVIKTYKNNLYSPEIGIVIIKIKEPFPIWASIVLLLVAVAVFILAYYLIVKYVMNRSTPSRE